MRKEYTLYILNPLSVSDFRVHFKKMQEEFYTDETINAFKIRLTDEELVMFKLKYGQWAVAYKPSPFQ